MKTEQPYARCACVGWIEPQGRAPGLGPDRQAAACHPAAPVRLAGHRSGRAGESGRLGARAVPLTAFRLDCGAGGNPRKVQEKAIPWPFGVFQDQFAPVAVSCVLGCNQTHPGSSIG